eukprot:IDg11541t1
MFEICLPFVSEKLTSAASVRCSFSIPPSCMQVNGVHRCSRVSPSAIGRGGRNYRRSTSACEIAQRRSSHYIGRIIWATSLYKCEEFLDASIFRGSLKDRSEEVANEGYEYPCGPFNVLSLHRIFAQWFC